MHCMRDAPSIDLFLAQATHPDLQPLIQRRLDELSDFADVPLSELVQFDILDSTDSIAALDQALGRSLLNSAIDLCARHAAWFELTVIVGDDGFGHVIYIPTTTEDRDLFALCTRLVNTAGEEHP